MSEGKHTPGPWTWETESGEWPDHNLIGGDGDSVMWWDFDLGFRFNNEANARLITAAPDMMEALQSLMDLNDNGGPFGGEIYQDRVDRAWNSARAAIAKATNQ